MNQSNTGVKKIDLFWVVFSVVFLIVSIIFWQTGKNVLPTFMFVPIGILLSVKELISKLLYNILRILLSLGILYYFLIFIM